MKTELEPQDIELIAERVVELLRPYLVNRVGHEDDTLLDVRGLAQYLGVKPQWVYEKVHNNEIPHYKVGKYPRFRKSEIDEWLQERRKGRKPTNTVRRLLEPTRIKP